MADHLQECVGLFDNENLRRMAAHAISQRTVLI
jgi:hypothetical protein